MPTEFDFITDLCEKYIEGIDSVPESLDALTASQRRDLPGLAFSHRILPLLNDYAEQLPDNVAARIRQCTQEVTRSALGQSAELIRVAGALKKRGIPFTTLKGIPLSILLHGNIAKRHSVDIDILISEKNLDECCKLFGEMGYRQFKPEFELTGKRYFYYKKLNKDVSFYHPSKQVLVELHFACFNLPGYWKLESEQLIETSCSVQIGKSALPCLEPTYMVLYLCAHGAKHYFHRLKWLVDIALLIRQISLEEWNTTLKYAQRHQLHRPLAQAVGLLRKLFDFQLPEEFEIPPWDKTTRWMIEVAMDRLKAPDPLPASFKKLWLDLYYRLSLKPEIFYKAKVVGYVATVRPYDWTRFSLPDALFFLYFPLRPLFFIWRRLTDGNRNAK